MSFAAFFALLPAPLADEPALSADFATDSRPEDAEDDAPLPFESKDESDLIAFARLRIFPMTVLITWITGESAAMSPCPIVAFRLSNCN